MKTLTVGGAVVDSIAIINSDNIEHITMRNADASFLLLEEGRKTEAEEISTHPGGGAVNAAISMSRLGIDVSTLVKLGRDQRADFILGALEKEGVSTRWVMRDDRLPTGAAVLLSSHERNAAIFAFRGANTLLSMKDIKPEALAVDQLYISSLSNESADCFPELVKAAKEAGCKVAANPGIRQLTARGRAFLDTVGLLDMLIMNSVEASVLAPAFSTLEGEGGPILPYEQDETMPHLLRRGLSSGGFQISLLRYFQCILKTGCKMAVVTDGGGGSFVATNDAILYCPIKRTEVVGTTGAGDAFSSTLVALTGLGWPLEKALKSAAINAAAVVGYADTQTGLMKIEELEYAVNRESELQVREWDMASVSSIAA
jgi:ribokinase